MEEIPQEATWTLDATEAETGAVSVGDNFHLRTYYVATIGDQTTNFDSNCPVPQCLLQRFDHVEDCKTEFESLSGRQSKMLSFSSRC